MATTFAVPDGRVAMAATTYTGTGATLAVSNAVNTVSFQPDLVWLKARNDIYDHYLLDSVRGATKTISSNLITAEATYTNNLTSFNTNGFSLGNQNNINFLTNTYVGWQWKAGGTAVSNTAGTITSSVSANTTAGFSVVTYTGTGANATVGHGLGVAPGMVITKSRSDNTYGWATYHTSVGAGGCLFINTTGATNSGVNIWNNTGPTTSVFSIGTDAYANFNTKTYVAYCWAPVAGYSAFGSYTGNGSADGPFIYTGFRPRWVMIKSSTDATVGWLVYDSSRNTYNSTGANLRPNTADIEGTQTANLLDFVSNGVKIRGDNTGSINLSAATYIYAAFAESAFKFSNAR
jgi:hypothetical protein